MEGELLLPGSGVTFSAACGLRLERQLDYLAVINAYLRSVRYNYPEKSLYIVNSEWSHARLAGTPGSIQVAHSDNEYVKVSDLHTATAFYKAVMVSNGSCIAKR